MKPLSFICIALVFSTIYLLINCSVYGESCLLTAFYHSGSFRNHLIGFGKKIKMLFTTQGRSVLGKTVPSVLCTARGLGPRAVSKTSRTVFPNTDLPSGE